MVSKAEQTDTSGAVAALRKFVTDEALPLWASSGWDDANGGFVERLNADGSPDLDAPRRTFTQARQIYCFAKAAQFDWHPGARTIAIDGTVHLLTRVRTNVANEGLPHITDRACSVLDARRDTSDHAAVLLGLAGVFELTRDAQIRSEMDAILLLIDRQLRSSDGGFVEGLPPSLPRRLMTHSHMFEAMIALFDATGEPVFQQRAGEFFGLFMANLLHHASGTLGEYYENDWANIAPVRIAPGHMAEWVWLLRGFERTTGCPTAKHRTMLMQSLTRYRDAQSGLLYDEGQRDGAILKPTHQLSTQASFAKAFIAQAEAKEADAAYGARAVIHHLHQLYLRHPVRGCWYSRLDREGPSQTEAIPASAFYDIICLLSESEQILN